MSEQFLIEIERELSHIADMPDWHNPTERIRDLARKVATELELTRLRNRTAA